MLLRGSYYNPVSLSAGHNAVAGAAVSDQFYSAPQQTDTFTVAEADQLASFSGQPASNTAFRNASDWLLEKFNRLASPFITPFIGSPKIATLAPEISTMIAGILTMFGTAPIFVPFLFMPASVGDKGLGDDEASKLDSQGHELLKIGQYKESADAFAKCAELHKTSGETLFYELSRYWRGEALFKGEYHIEYVKVYRDSPEAKVIDGIMLMDEGRYTKALELFSVATDTFEELDALSVHDQFGAALALKEAADILSQGNKIALAEKRWQEVAAQGIATKRGVPFQKVVELLDLRKIVMKIFDNIDDATWRLKRVGNALKDKGEFNAALYIYGHASLILQTIGDIKNEAFARAREAQALIGAGMIQEGIKCYERAAQLFRQLGNRFEELKTREWQGDMLFRASLYNDSADTYKIALDLALATNDKQRQLFILTKLGRSLIFSGKYDEGIAKYEEATAIHRTNGNSQGEAKTYQFLAESLLKTNKPERATKVFEKIADILHTKPQDGVNR